LCNAQTKFKAFKDAAMKTARDKAKVMIGASEAKKESLKKEMKVLLNTTPDVTPSSDTNTVGRNPATLCSADTPHNREQNTTTRDMPAEPGTHCHECDQKRRAEGAALIQKKINEIIDRQCERKRLETRVRGATELNHITKYAVNLSKEKKPRDTIEFLRCTDISPEKGSKRLSEMAEIARDYHNDLERDNELTNMQTREAALRDALESVPPPRQGVNMDDLGRKLIENDILQAVNEAAAGRASGMNGVISEFWQRLHGMYKESNETTDAEGITTKRGNIIKVLTWVYNDIEEHGVTEGTDFAIGWMCPIFKRRTRLILRTTAQLQC
jgi:hypothetical protein